MSPKVSVLKKKGSFFLSKSQWKGVSFGFGERSYVLPFADEWRDREMPMSTFTIFLFFMSIVKCSHVACQI